MRHRRDSIRPLTFLSHSADRFGRNIELGVFGVPLETAVIPHCCGKKVIGTGRTPSPGFQTNHWMTKHNPPSCFSDALQWLLKRTPRMTRLILAATRYRPDWRIGRQFRSAHLTFRNVGANDPNFLSEKFDSQFRPRQ